MRRNFDYVTFADYEADTRDLAQQATAAIEMWKKKAKDAERLVLALILAAGGEVQVSDYILAKANDPLSLETWRDERNVRYTFKVSQG